MAADKRNAITIFCFFLHGNFTKLKYIIKIKNKFLKLNCDVNWHWRQLLIYGCGFMVFKATFNNISVISLRLWICHVRSIGWVRHSKGRLTPTFFNSILKIIWLIRYICEHTTGPPFFFLHIFFTPIKICKNNARYQDIITKTVL